MKNLILICLFAVLFFQCKNDQPKEEGDNNTLGKIEISVSGSEEAFPFFHEGLLLLHSFEFEDAAEKFVEAQKIDSNFVMAYWGEAMSYNHPLWRERYTEDGQAALNKLADTPEKRLAKAETPLEKDFLQAVEILYQEGDKKELDIAYRDKMEELYKKYPEHHEVSAFYALSLLGATKNGRENGAYQKGAKIAQSIIDENPKHPGALHYLIHSYDDPDYASLALDAANSYAHVAPDAEHALHMPSHIYVALGMWDDVIKSNIASYEASVKRMKEKELDSDARGYHAFKWLMYGYMQKGDFAKAREMVYDMKKYCDEIPSSRARAHFIMMQGAYLVESGNWEDSIANVTVETDKLNINIKGVQLFTQGMSAYAKKNKATLIQQIRKLEDLRLKGEQLMIEGAPKMCSGVSRYLQPPTTNEVSSTKVLELELKGLLALLDKNEKLAEKYFVDATETEQSTSYNFGPPGIVKPSSELYGEWLLEKNRHAEAKAQFEKVLVRAPKRLLAEQGIKKASSDS